MSNLLISIITFAAAVYLFIVAKTINKIIDKRINLQREQKKLLDEYKEKLTDYQNELDDYQNELDETYIRILQYKAELDRYKKLTIMYRKFLFNINHNHISNISK